MSSRILRPAAISSGLRAFGTVSDTRIVSPMPRLMSCSKAIRVLMIAVGRQPGLGHAQVQRHIRPGLGEPAIHLDHLRRIGVLQRHAVPREAQLVEQLAVLQRTFEHRRERIAGSYFSSFAGSTLPQFTPTRIAQSWSRGDARPDTAPSPATASRARGDRDGPGCSGSCRHAARPLGQAIVLLQIDRQVRRRLLANLRQRLGLVPLSTAIRTTSAPAAVQRVHLRDGRVDVVRLRRRHALHGDRMPAANGDAADATLRVGFRSISIFSQIFRTGFTGSTRRGSNGKASNPVIMSIIQHPLVAYRKARTP